MGDGNDGGEPNALAILIGMTELFRKAADWYTALPAMAQATLRVVLILVGTLATMFLARVIVRRASRRKGDEDPIATAMVNRILQVVILLIGVELALHTLDIHLTALLAASGFLAVAFGLGLKVLVESAIAGTVLRFEQVIRRGDLIEMNGRWLRVRSIGFRTTVGVSMDDEDLVIPNTAMGQATVINLTRHGSLYRIRTDIGVAYESDLKLVRKTLEDCVEKLEFRSQKRTSKVYLEEFGDSSVNFSLRVWIDDVANARGRRSELNEAAWWALKDAGITIAFPQLDVHFDRAGPDAPAENAP